MHKLALADIMRGGQALFPTAGFEKVGADSSVTYRRETETESFDEGLRFVRTRAFRYRAEAHCTVWHIENAYNTLVEVVDSEWAAELQGAVVPGHHRWEIHHYMVYIEDSGCYEVASESWEWLPSAAI